MMSSNKGLERKQIFLVVLQNFLLNTAIPASKHSLLTRALDVLNKWFAIRAVHVPMPDSFTHQEGWSSLRRAMKEHSYWLSHEELRCLACCCSCHLTLHISHDLGASANTLACEHVVGLPGTCKSCHVMLRLGNRGQSRGGSFSFVSKSGGLQARVGSINPPPTPLYPSKSSNTGGKPS